MTEKTDFYQNVYSGLSRKCDELEKHRADLEIQLDEVAKEIDSLRQTMSHLATLAGYNFQNEVTKLGITEAARKILSKDKDAWMSVNDIKIQMIERGYDFSKYSAPDASLHTTLKRLVEAERADFKKEDWNTFYKFKETDDDLPF